MFFEMHDENIIGFKELTAADLGFSKTSHQTHIALFNDILKYLPDHDQSCDALLIYENTVKTYSLLFDRIKEPLGNKFRSPKIRLGPPNKQSIARQIREIATTKKDVPWFLIWFGLKSSQAVFILFNNESHTYADISKIINIHPNVKGRIIGSNESFKRLNGYIASLLNNKTKDMQEDLELYSQENFKIDKKYRPFDIYKAKSLFSKTGRTGEELINNHFEILKSKKLIDSFEWLNKSFESGLPYDFVYVQNGKKKSVDVKSTSYTFKQGIFFSSNEINYIANCTIPYEIFRVYDINNLSFSLRNCNSFQQKARCIATKTSEFCKNLNIPDTSIALVNFCINPCSLNFSAETVINLNADVLLKN